MDMATHPREYTERHSALQVLADIASISEPNSIHLDTRRSEDDSILDSITSRYDPTAIVIQDGIPCVPSSCHKYPTILNIDIDVSKAANSVIAGIPVEVVKTQAQNAPAQRISSSLYVVASIAAIQIPLKQSQEVQRWLKLKRKFSHIVDRQLDNLLSGQTQDRNYAKDFRISGPIKAGFISVITSSLDIY
jgi:hypothetical protein